MTPTNNTPAQPKPIRNDLFFISSDGKKLTRDEFVQKYWDFGKDYIRMDVEVGRDEIEQLIVNNLEALWNEHLTGMRDLVELTYKRCLGEQAADEGKDFSGREAAQEPANEQPEKKEKRIKAPVGTTKHRVFQFLFMLLGMLIGFLLLLLFELVKGV